MALNVQYLNFVKGCEGLSVKPFTGTEHKYMKNIERKSRFVKGVNSVKGFIIINRRRCETGIYNS